MLMQHEMLKLLLNKCKTINHLKQTHLQLLINGCNNSLLHNLITVSSGLISLDYAFKILRTSNSSNLDVIAYNTLIKCFFIHGNERNCVTTKCNPINVYKEMKKQGFLPNGFTFTYLLKRCNDNLDVGRMIHGDVLKMGFDVSSLFVGNSLLNFYGKHDGGIDMACKVFDEMHERDVVSWNTMIRMRMDCGDVGIAIELFESMPERSGVTWNCFITGLVNNGKMEYARDVFDKMPDKNEVSWNCMISGYIKMGDLRNAEVMFNGMPVVKKSVVTHTAIISGYAANGEIKKARKMFNRMGEKKKCCDLECYDCWLRKQKRI